MVCVYRNEAFGRQLDLGHWSAVRDTVIEFSPENERSLVRDSLTLCVQAIEVLMIRTNISMAY